MEQTRITALDEAIQLVDGARRQMEIEVMALSRLLKEGQIQIDDYTKRQGELRAAKVEPIQTKVDEALSQTYRGAKLNQARYLKAAYDHLATGAAKLDAFAWKDAQLKAQCRSEAAYRQERDKERAAIQREAQELTRDQLFSATGSSV
jgi:hypothetical protein